MATYSRSQSSTGTADPSLSSLLSSKTITSIIVKSMENVNKDNDTEDNETETDNENENNEIPDLKNIIAEGINASDLVKNNKDKDNNSKDKDKNNKDKDNNSKDKDKDNKDNDLDDLLKDKNNEGNKDNNPDDLLKDKNDKNNKEKEEDELTPLLKGKNNKDKDNNTKKKDSTVKTLTAAVIGAVIGKSAMANSMKDIGSGFKETTSAILKSKSLREGTGKVVSGAGKAAGGLVSGVGALGGSAIAGIGKLFGPVGAIIGKTVGAAVSAPFKLIGGTITKAIGTLGNLLSMPLKEMVTKTGLIVAVASQLFVFLEGLIAKFKADSDINRIDMIAKIKSFVSVIPDKIKLSLEKILSKVRIMGQPIFGTMSKDEEKELKSLKKDKDVVNYGNLLEVDIPEKQQQQQAILDELQHQYNLDTGGTLDLSKYNLNTTAGKEALKQEWLSKVDNSQISEETINTLLSDYSYTTSSLDDAQKRANYLANNDPKIKRFLELNEQSKQGLTSEYFEEQEAKLEEKQDKLEDSYRTQGIVKEMEKGDWTAYENKRAKEKWGDEVVDIAHTRYQGSHEGTEYNFAPATAAEKFLNNQYKAWTDAWKTMIKDTAQNTVGVNVNFNQKTSKSNPV